MRTTIDDAGRLVIPKRLRDQLGLRGGSLLEIRLVDDRLEVQPAATEMKLVRRGKGLVATTAEPLPTIGVKEVREIVEKQRR